MPKSCTLGTGNCGPEVLSGATLTLVCGQAAAELLRDTVPKLGRLGILFDGGTAAAVQEKGEVQAAARTLGLEVVRKTITTLALDARLPTIFTNAETVRAGALMSYEPDFPALFRRAAEIVDRILRGTKAGDIPVEQPTKFDLAINLKTAKALGLTVSDKMLALAR